MADERYTFDQARVRLEEIVAQVRKKDVSLETSIELLEEGVRLANMCTELSDHTEWRAVTEENEPDGDGAAGDVSGSEPDDATETGSETPGEISDAADDTDASEGDSE